MEITITLIAATIAGVIGGAIDVNLHLTNTPMMYVVIIGMLGLYVILDLILQKLARLLPIRGGVPCDSEVNPANPIRSEIHS